MLFSTHERFDYKRENIKIGQNILVETFMKNKTIIEVKGNVIAIYPCFALVKTKNYLTCVNFI